MVDLQSLMHAVHSWQIKTFNSQTPISKAIHLRKEVDELVAELQDSVVYSPNNTLLRREIADCFMLLIGICTVSEFNETDIIEAVYEKLEINKHRKWGNPDKHGVVQHIREEDK